MLGKIIEIPPSAAYTPSTFLHYKCMTLWRKIHGQFEIPSFYML